MKSGSSTSRGGSSLSLVVSSAVGIATVLVAARYGYVYYHQNSKKKSCNTKSEEDDQVPSCSVADVEIVDTDANGASTDIMPAKSSSDSAAAEERISTNQNDDNDVQQQQEHMQQKRKENGAFPRDWLRQLLLSHAHNHPNLPQSLQDKALVVAPMVDASDLPYRLLARRYNTNLCFTPMIHARMFIEKEGYRRKF